MPHNKLNTLRENLKQYPVLLVGFSGGVDSTFLAKVATDSLGDNCHLITCVSPTMAQDEIDDAISLAQELGFERRHHVIRSNELNRPGFAENPRHRCALCKTELMEHAMPLAKSLGAHIALGTNVDDLGDIRPGIEAAQSSGALSPLVDASLCKSDIRVLSKELNLRTWDKPQLACLSSRFPYGTKITESKLRAVDRLESHVRSFGFKNVRVRYHDTVARIEIDSKHFMKIHEPAISQSIIEEGQHCGFNYVAIDLKGFRSGSLNEPLIQIRQKD